MNSSRVQLALDVNDLEEAIAFYGKLFDATPHKRRDGYANFAITDPPLKLVLDEDGTVSAMSEAAAVSGCCTDATEVSTSQSVACC